MNNAETLKAGIDAGICNRALALVIAEYEQGYDQERNRDEMDAHLATKPICGKPGLGFKAWRKKLNELREESEMIFGRSTGRAIYEYTSANDLMYRPSDLRDGSHIEMRRSAQSARDEEIERAREFVVANYTPESDTLCLADAVKYVLEEMYAR